MNAIIHDLSTHTSYTAACAADCRGADRHAYELACMLGQTVTMGKIIVEPVTSEPNYE